MEEYVRAGDTASNLDEFVHDLATNLRSGRYKRSSVTALELSEKLRSRIKEKNGRLVYVRNNGSTFDVQIDKRKEFKRADTFLKRLTNLDLRELGVGARDPVIDKIDEDIVDGPTTAGNAENPIDLTGDEEIFHKGETVKIKDLFEHWKEVKTTRDRLNAETAKYLVAKEKVEKMKQYGEGEVFIKLYEGIMEDALKNINDLRPEVNNQLRSIRDSVGRFLSRDVGLVELVKRLFREQGVTIAAIVTALGMTIGVIVESLGGAVKRISGGVGGNKGGGGFVERSLHKFANLPKWLAKKAGDSLPGIIGTVVSFLFSSASKVVEFMANSTWALFLFVSAATVAYINKYVIK